MAVFGFLPAVRQALVVGFLTLARTWFNQTITAQSFSFPIASQAWRPGLGPVLTSAMAVFTAACLAHQASLQWAALFAGAVLFLLVVCPLWLRSLRKYKQ